MRQNSNPRASWKLVLRAQRDGHYPYGPETMAVQGGLQIVDSGSADKAAAEE
jgi:hypothetical protein